MDTKQIVLSRLIDAREEAKRFLVLVNRAVDSVDTPKRDYFRDREYAAAKRASLDLSRTLSDMRKSPWKEI